MRIWIGKLLVAALLGALSVPRPAVAAEVAPIYKGPAPPKVSREEAVAAVERHFAMPAGRGSISAVFDEGLLEPPSWYVRYETDYGTVSRTIARVDATSGRVLMYNNVAVSDRDVQVGPLPWDESVARTKAWTLVEQLFPDLASSLRPFPAGSAYLVGNQPWDVVTFTWVREYQGLPAPGQAVRVSVERGTFNLVGLESTLDQPVAFGTTSPGISGAQALEWFRSAEPQLIYQAVRLDEVIVKMVPTYLFTEANRQLVAARNLPERTVGKVPAEQLQPIPQCPAAGPAAPLAREDVPPLARSLLDVPYRPNDYRWESRSLIPNYSTIVLATETGRREATIDLSTGRVVSLTRANQPSPDYKPPQNAEGWRALQEKARHVALDAVRDYYPHLCSELR